MENYFIELGNYARHYSTVRLAIISVVIWFSIKMLRDSSSEKDRGSIIVSLILFLFGYLIFGFYTILLFNAKNKQNEVGQKLWSGLFETLDIQKPYLDPALILLTIGFVIYIIFFLITVKRLFKRTP